MNTHEVKSGTVSVQQSVVVVFCVVVSFRRSVASLMLFV